MSSSTIVLMVMPLIVLQIALQVYALYDLWKTQGPNQISWPWVGIIVIGGLLGPLAYFVFGRKGGEV
jgi:hypothetical protein